MMALALSGPGIFWVNSGPLNATAFPYADYVKWYEGVHIPDWMGAKKGASKNFLSLSGMVPENLDECLLLLKFLPCCWR